MEASLADELSMLDPGAELHSASSETGAAPEAEPETGSSGAEAVSAEPSAASPAEKARIKLAVPEAFSSDMHGSAQARALGGGAEADEAAIEELEGELAEMQEQLQVGAAKLALPKELFARAHTTPPAPLAA